MATEETMPHQLAPPPDEVEHTMFGRSASAKARRRVVVHKAAELFEQNGFHGTSMQDIADSVGITKAALYHYVASKEELLYEIHNAFVASMLEMAKSFTEEQADPEEQLKFFIRNIFETVAQYRPYVRAFFQELNVLTGEWHDKIKSQRDEYELLVEDCLERGVDQGKFNLPTTKRLSAMFIFGACNWSYQWMRPDGAVSVDELVDIWYALTMSGLRGASDAER